MMPVAGVFVASLIAVLALTPLARWAALAGGIVDHADGHRKLHLAPVPLQGGVAVFLAYALGVAMACWLNPAGAAPRWLVSGGLICLVGWCDDVWKLAPRWKLLGQTLAVAPLVATEWPASALMVAGQQVALGWCGAPLLLVWLLACVNALNFLDGVDGLAASCGLVAAAFLATMAQAAGQTSALFAAVALCGALAGFLVFNVAPAKIYLGDAGSMMVGLALAALSINVFQTRGGAVQPEGMLLLLAVPLLDLLLAVSRRTLSGRPFWQADRFHIHHRLLERGCTPHETTAFLAGLCVLFGLAAAVIKATGAVWPICLASCGVFALLVRSEYVGHYEWSLTKRRLANVMFTFAARFGHPTVGLDVPEYAVLAGELDTANWERLKNLVKSRSVAQFEVQAGRAARLDWSESHVSPGAPAGNLAMRLEFHGNSDGWCRMHIRLRDDVTAEPWRAAELFAALGHFGRFWSERAEAEETAVVPIRGQRRAA